MRVDFTDYAEVAELGRTKSGKRAAVAQTRPAAPKRVVSNKCPSGKWRAKDHKAAVRKLHGAKNAGKFELDMNGHTNRQECRTYFCVDCKGHHLTSKREWTTFKNSVAA